MAVADLSAWESPASAASDVAASEQFARDLRRHAVLMTARGGGSHVGSNLSIADIVAVLYSSVLEVNPSDPYDHGRDRFILSKGHACAVLYAALALKGFFPRSWLDTFYLDGSMLAGHVTHRGVPGVELSTGSLGHGLPVAVGMATALRRTDAARVFVLLSDGECDEGSVWEAALFAGHHRVGRLTAIVDYNKIQSLGTTTETLDLEPFADKWRAFGWRVVEVDGHDHAQLHQALAGAQIAEGDRPTCVIAHTVKGKGVSFMEGSVLWHYRTAAGDELAQALAEIGDSSNGNGSGNGNGAGHDSRTVANGTANNGTANGTTNGTPNNGDKAHP